MKFKLIDLIKNLDYRYTFNLQEDFDNSGLQVGNLDDDINGILLCMDITEESLEYAIKNNYNCIISHHPLFFNKIKSIEFSSSSYRKLEMIFNNRINVLSLHTPLDLHEDGISKALSNKIKLKNTDFFIRKDENHGYGIKGNIESTSLINLLSKIKNEFGYNIIFYGDEHSIINTIAVLGGSGAFSIKNAIENKIDLLISADFKYHDIQYALENKINIIDLGHYESEIFGLENLKKYIVNSMKITKEKVYLFDKNIFQKKIY